jgi:diacylglycerol kinase (ATP)
MRKAHSENFWFINRFKSFRYAFIGFWTLLKTQQSAWCHAVLTAVVVVVGLCYGLSQSEWCWLILAMAAVWSAEALNTSIEFLADVVSPEFHPLIKRSKDLAAAAVLATLIAALAIGILTLGPYISAHINSVAQGLPERRIENSHPQ